MLFFKRICVLSFFIVFFNSSVYASGIEASWGIGFGYSAFELDADEGTVESINEVTPIHLFYLAEMGSTSRLNVELFHYDLKFDSKPAQTIGAQVLNTGLNFLYEEELKISNYFKPILGVGLQLSKVAQTSRHSTTANGDLDSKLPDVDEFAASMLVSAGYDVQVTDGMVVYGRLMQTIGISNDLTETQFLIAFMFKTR